MERLRKKLKDVERFFQEYGHIKMFQFSQYYIFVLYLFSQIAYVNNNNIQS